MMKKVISFFVFTFCFVSIALGATGTATPAVYGVTFNKIELHNKETNTWVTIGEGDAYFDIAAANAGALVGNYFSNVEIPAGTYDKVRTKLSRNIKLQGSGNIGAITYYTTAAQVANFGTAVPLGRAISASNAVTSAVEGTFQIPGDAAPGAPAGYTRVSIDADYFTDEIAAPTFVEFTIGRGTPKTIQLNFDVAGKMTFNDNGPGGADVAYCDPPVVTATIQ